VQNRLQKDESATKSVDRPVPRQTVLNNKLTLLNKSQEDGSAKNSLKSVTMPQSSAILPPTAAKMLQHIPTTADLPDKDIKMKDTAQDMSGINIAETGDAGADESDMSQSWYKS